MHQWRQLPNPFIYIFKTGVWKSLPKNISKIIKYDLWLHKILYILTVYKKKIICVLNTLTTGVCAF